jgi:hypothetical protein
MKEDLIGNWYYSDGNKIDSQFRFYKDSIVFINSFGWKSSLKWRIDSDKIYTSYLNESGPTYKFKLLNDKQTLRIEFTNDDLSESVNFIKAKNSNDFYFQNIIGLEIELPTKESEFEHIDSSHYLNFNIYAGYDVNNLVVKPDSSTDLNNLTKEVAEFKENSRDELKKHIKFNLIADKKISKSKIDSIKNLLKKTSIELILRTYQIEKLDDINDSNWIQVQE